MRRLPLAVFCRATALRAQHPLLEGLAEDPRFETVVWLVDEGGPWLRVDVGSEADKAAYGLAPASELRRLRALSRDPDVLAPLLALRFLTGPAAVRPRTVLGFEVDAEGYLAAALGRILGVPSAVIATTLPTQEPVRTVEPLKSSARRLRKALGWGATMLAASEDVVDGLARRGAQPLVAAGRDERQRWRRLAKIWTEVVVELSGQGVSRTSRS